MIVEQADVQSNSNGDGESGEIVDGKVVVDEANKTALVPLHKLSRDALRTEPVPTEIHFTSNFGVTSTLLIKGNFHVSNSI